MIDGPRPARLGEYDELMRLLERSYGMIRERFENGYPHVCRRKTAIMKGVS